jgi:hypothetical protein
MLEVFLMTPTRPPPMTGPQAVFPKEYHRFCHGFLPVSVKVDNSVGGNH